MGYADLNVGNSGMYLRIESGVPVDIRLLDEEPTETFRHTKTENGQTRSFDCSGDDCEYCKSGDHSPAKQRFVTNVYNHALQKVQLFEFGMMVAKQLVSIAKSLQEESRDIMTVDLRIEATGSGMAKKYAVTPRHTSKLVPEGLVRLKPVKRSLNLGF